MLNKIFFAIKCRVFGRLPFSITCAGGGSYILRPRRISGGKFIQIGRNVKIHENSWIDAIGIYASQEFSPFINIGDDVYIGRYSCIISVNKVIIGAGCVLSEHVYIADNAHGYAPGGGHIMKQKITSKGAIEIGENSFIGYRAVICPDVRLGKNCVVGANSVVTKDFPDYSMIAGAPAILLKRYSLISGIWEKVKGAE